VRIRQSRETSLIQRPPPCSLRPTTPPSPLPGRLPGEEDPAAAAAPSPAATAAQEAAARQAAAARATPAADARAATAAVEGGHRRRVRRSPRLSRCTTDVDEVGLGQRLWYHLADILPMRPATRSKAGERGSTNSVSD
jgi:hypothetical protein